MILEMNKVKQLIISRLFVSSSICMCCGKRDCVALNRNLPTVLDTDDVLHAINLDESFFKEEVEWK